MLRRLKVDRMMEPHGQAVVPPSNTRLRQGLCGLSAHQATSAVALIRIHPRANPWSSA